MKVLAILGSPKGKGNTHDLVKQAETMMNKLDSSVEFEYVLLKDIKLEPCKGCYQCLKHGEERCPIQDQRELLENKMTEADGVIFASPVYVYNVSWLMKNFMDRFSYICHRPRFHQKPAFILSTTGAVGLKFVLSLMAFSIGTWGFSEKSKLGLIIPPELTHDERKALYKRNEERIMKQAKSFYLKMKNKKVKKPGFIGLVTFKLQQYAFSKADKELADYQYWNMKGWLKESSSYYYPVRINPVKKFLANTIIKINRLLNFV